MTQVENNMQLIGNQLLMALAPYLSKVRVLGMGSGKTVQAMIDQWHQLPNFSKLQIECYVPSSQATFQALREARLPAVPFLAHHDIDLYLDSADEINRFGIMIKGGGGALTGEKLLASAAKHFIMVGDAKKLVPLLGTFPIAIEILPVARSFIAKKLIALGGQPRYREGFVSDFGNIILDVSHLDLTDAIHLEQEIKSWPGVVEVGLFAKHRADDIILVRQGQIETITSAVSV